MPSPNVCTVTLEIRSFPRLLVHLVDATDDPIERRRLAGLGRWEMRVDGGPWRVLELGAMN